MRRFRNPLRNSALDREEHSYQRETEELREQIYQRPQTPQSSSPLRTDFDEITNTRPDRSTAHFDPPTQHSPIAEDFDAPTTALDTRPTTAVIDISRIPTIPTPSTSISRRPVRPSRPPLNYARQYSDENGTASASKPDVFPDQRHQDVLDDFNDYDQFLDETEDHNGKNLYRSGSLAQSSRQPVMERPSNRLVDGATTAGTGSFQSQTQSQSQSKSLSRPSNLDSALLGNSKKSSTNLGRNMSFKRSPNSRNEYTMIETQIVQQDKNKTVEVSAWREQVAREAADDYAKMSVYYVTQNDVLEAGRGAFKEFRVETTKEELPETSLEYPRSPPIRRVQRMRSLSEGSFTNLRPGARPTSPFPLKSKAHHTSLRATAGRAPPTPPLSLDSTSPRLSPPFERRGSGSKGKSRTRGSGSTSPPAPPRKDSNIQISIRRMIPSFSSVEAVLADCEPSLSHIAPILARLGITSEAHLLAVIKLREETRDREVREEALRRGITVVEWAVFIDKLLSITTNR